MDKNIYTMCYFDNYKEKEKENFFFMLFVYIKK